ncbi:uncharacterized protein LOC131162314 [Malania oleifera]|uniref:uncharacterized protein LOC131162314 n=1 Tax=Malania oleifera TaxID=397392 RepID=UPI0025AE453B|nr:uncharacterized protein LOC131162314 [Malania oleifera]
MENEKESTGEIEETSETIGAQETPSPSPKPRSVKTKVPEVEVRLFRRGKGPIDVFKSTLGGWDQDQLEVRDILDKYGFKSLYAMTLDSGRAAPIRFNQKNGRSLLSYRDGSVISVDGEPKDSRMKPVTKILVGVAVTSLLITLVLKERPQWITKSNFQGVSFPPWVLACMVIVFTRMRKRTGYLLKKFGW